MLAIAREPPPGEHARLSTSGLYDYDAVVIGAGPSGARTAALLSAQGHRVALIERDEQAGRPVHCTGIVSNECLEAYGLPESLILHSINAFVLRSPKGHQAYMRRRGVQAHVLDRVAMDLHLVAEAVEAGAMLLTSTQVKRVTWTGDGVELDAVSGESPMRLSARSAVIATGFGAPLARDLGFSDVREVVSGCQAVVAAVDIEDVEVFTGDGLGHGGYGWLVPWKPGFALAGVLTRKHAMSYMRHHIERLQQDGRVGAVQQVFTCRPVPLGLAKRTVADGILGVGDAVNQVKPTTGGGIYYGLLGAGAAAQTIGEALEAGDVSAMGLRAYEPRWRAMMESEIRQGYLLRRLCEQLPEAMVEQLHRLLRVPGIHRALLAAAPSFDWHSSPLLRVLDRLQRHDTPALELTP